MARLAVLRSAIFNGVRRQELASSWRQQTKAMKSTTAARPERILEPPYPEKMQIPEATITEFVWQDVGQWLSKPAVTCGSSGRSYSHGETRALCRRFANALLGAVGLRQGDVLGLLLPNMPEFVIAIHGAIEAGIIVTFANPLYTPDEIGRQFMNAGVRASVTIPQLLPVMAQVGRSLPDYKWTIAVGGELQADGTVLSFQRLLSESVDADIPKLSPGDVALLPYSSGTTGLPKGVKLSHRNLVANLQQISHPDILLHVPTTETTQEVALSVLPYFHIYGFNGILNPTILYGMHIVSIPKFTPEDYIGCVIKFKPTILFVVPSLMLFLASHPSVTREHLSSIKHVVCGAAPATKNLIDKFKSKVDRDINIRQGYGMTESAPVTIFPSKHAPLSKMGSCGQIVPETQAKVVDLTTGQSLGPHESGELLIRGPQVMLGYLNNDEATQETIDPDGWLHTGDVAYYDEDEYFYIVDRTKELIKVKGNQVSPTELESILAGEVPRAFVVRHPDYQSLTEADVQEYVEPKVASYKKLAGGVKFIDVIPRNPAGKVLRQQLKVLGDKSPIQ
ncbi:4-coumarate--CoA ligase-like [Zootermopsis nevadensis]|uniref:4-coumarate--CoA ligase-like n=1 Tax=Zootermopsis nevadensis TaxID=136037 RepID=UPI000B8E3885|nr:4-coumarate--CoA ligase-like [Zootermopsis nevadensis]